MASAVVDIDTTCIKQDDFELSATNLGEGGFGLVKRAIHKKTGQVFALKTISIENCDGTDRQFLKLCDFNLAKAHEYSSHTQLTGTQLYMAPEVRYGRKYNFKADVYSLAVMGLKMFGLLASDQDRFVELIHQALAEYKDSKLIEPMTAILALLEDCLNKDKDHYNDRKSSGEVLDALKQLDIGKVANVECNPDHFQSIAFYHRFIIAKL